MKKSIAQENFKTLKRLRGRKAQRYFQKSASPQASAQDFEPVSPSSLLMRPKWLSYTRFSEETVQASSVQHMLPWVFFKAHLRFIPKSLFLPTNKPL